jgi:hypothetical protein
MNRSIIFLLVLLLGNATGVRAWGSGGMRTVALTGTAAAGAGATFSMLQTNGKLNNAGQTAFYGEVAGAGVDVSNNAGVWSYDPSGGAELFAREGGAAPAAGTHFNGFGSPTINNSGRLAFRGLVSDGVTSRGAVWTQGATGVLAQIAQSGQIAPGTNVAFASFGVELGDNGQSVIPGRLNSFEVEEGVWRHEGGGPLVKVSADRDPAPGTSTQYSNFGGYSSNNQGRVAFVSGLMDVNGGGTQAAGMWRDGAGGVQLIARHGDAAPGTAAQFEEFTFGQQTLLDGAGRATFAAFLMGAGVDGTNQAGIWSERGGNGLELVLRAGSGLAPGTSARFRHFSDVVQNESSEIAFYGRVSGEMAFTDSAGIWSEGPGGVLGLVAQLGTASPGASFPFSDIDGQTLAKNLPGQVAFLAEVSRDATPRATRYEGVWAQNRQGGLELIALEGALLDVSDNPLQTDLRTVLDLDFRSAGFNDRGQLAFYALFTDGSRGIFISDLVAVPEPQAAVLCLAGAVALIRRRAKSR